MRWVAAGGLLWAVSCAEPPAPKDHPSEPAGATEDSGYWTATLPTDDTVFEDPRRGEDTGLPPADSEVPDASDLYLRHGGVAWSQLDLKRGHVKLTAGEFACAELFDPGSPLAEGVHTDIDPLMDDALEPVWVDSYRPGMERPALTNTIVQFAGNGSPPAEDAVLTVHSWNDRTVVVSYVSSTLATEPIELWNCGEKGPWGL